MRATPWGPPLIDLVLAEEFRAGNVPAHVRLLPVAKRALQGLESRAVVG